MNVFILPSWYPSSANPLSGIFIKEQTEAVAAFAPMVCQSVSTWGHQSGHLSIRTPMQTVRALTWRLVTSGSEHFDCGKRIHEFYSPTLSWSPELPFGGVRCLIKANRKNLVDAIRHLGVINIIHAHVGYPGGVIARQLSQEFNIPYVLTEHMGPFPMPFLMSAGKPIAELQDAFQHAAAVVAVSPFLAEKIRGFQLADPTVVPNMVDESEFFPGKSCSEKFVFFSLCMLTDGKGIDDLLRAIAHWQPDPNRYEFRIAGDGPMAATYKVLAMRLGISDRICWIGAVRRKDVPELFRQCHVFVLPSHFETFGLVYSEAIASGKPLIATRCGGPESIVNDINGTLVDVGDTVALSLAMQAMAAEYTRYDPVAIRGDFMARFSRAKVVRQLVNIYKRVVGEI